MSTLDSAASPPEEDNYNESDDEDFDPNAAGPEAEGEASSDDDDDAAEAEAESTTKKPKAGKRKRVRKDDGAEAEDVGFENSGDETIIKRDTKRRKKQGNVGDGEDSGGEGGFVKTRRMRAAAAEEQARRPLATTDGATIDVEAMWAEMNDPEAAKKVQSRPAPVQEAEEEEEVKQDVRETQPEPVEDMIEIEETYKFAGEVQVTKKLVARTSAEGQKWLVEHPQVEPTTDHTQNESAATSKAKRHPDTGEPLLRPLRRISLWDPNPAGVVRGLPSNALADSDAGNKLRVVDKSKLGWHTEATVPKAAKATKLNVVEKSKMDWNAHVDAMGDKEDLAKAAKAKGSYLERRDFLERVEARKDEEERRVRVK